MYEALLMSFLYAAEERPHIEDLLKDFQKFRRDLETTPLESGGNIIPCKHHHIYTHCLHM